MSGYQITLVALTAGGFLATGTFIALYAARNRWWKTAAGRHMMGLSAVLFTTFGLLLAARWMGRALARPIWVVAMAALDAVLWGQVLLLLWAQRSVRSGASAGETPTGTGPATPAEPPAGRRRWP